MKQYVLPVMAAFVATALLLMLVVPLLKRRARQEILQYVTEHASKRGTPTMGGLVFVAVICVLSAVFCDLSVRSVAVSIAVVAAYAVVGFLDDFLKIKYRHNLGLRPYQKIIFQLAIAILVAIFLYGQPSGDRLYLPFVDKTVNIGWLCVPLAVFIFLACTNGVNLTDGLDGLATSTTICYLVGIFALIAVRSQKLASLGDPSAEDFMQFLPMICIAVGSLLAFLLFNSFPAKVFMGDVGSLALGALISCVSIFTDMSLVIPVLGVTFVTSCVSVILQVCYFKVTRGKRLFLMAPYHHHLQKKGLSETRICTIYSAATLLAAMILLYFGG